MPITPAQQEALDLIANSLERLANHFGAPYIPMPERDKKASINALTQSAVASAAAIRQALDHPVETDPPKAPVDVKPNVVQEVPPAPRVPVSVREYCREQMLSTHESNTKSLANYAGRIAKKRGTVARWSGRSEGRGERLYPHAIWNAAVIMQNAAKKIEEQKRAAREG